jgi:hypothetical protein
MTDEKSQIVTAASLGATAELRIRTYGARPIFYLAVECATALQAASIDNFVQAVDPGARRCPSLPAVA